MTPRTKTTPRARAPLPTVRTAKTTDYLEIMRLCEGLALENARMPVSWDLVEKAIIAGINVDNALIGVIGGDQLEAMIYLRLSDMWYSHTTILEDLFVYVDQPFRHTRNAKALVAFSKQTADRLQLKLIAGVISSKDTQAKIKLYTREYNQPAGAYFIYEG